MPSKMRTEALHRERQLVLICFITCIDFDRLNYNTDCYISDQDFVHVYSRFFLHHENRLMPVFSNQ